MNERKQVREVSWTKLFACELDLPKVETSAGKRCRCGNGNCKRAKHIRCVCGCHGVAHGIEQRKGMSTLDGPLGLDGLTVTVTKEGPRTSKETALFSRELGKLVFAFPPSACRVGLKNLCIRQDPSAGLSPFCHLPPSDLET
jgi:hypothetical protein